MKTIRRKRLRISKKELVISRRVLKNRTRQLILDLKKYKLRVCVCVCDAVMALFLLKKD